MSSKEQRKSLLLIFQGYKSLVHVVECIEIESKDLSKKLSKKFACSCSATDASSVQIQGDFFEDVKDFLMDEYKVKKKYILDGE